MAGDGNDPSMPMANQSSAPEIAFQAGYAIHEAFIRAFRSAFGCTPAAFRRRLVYDGGLPALNGIHYGYKLEIQFVASKGVIAMNVEIREIGPRKAVCISHRGPYFTIGGTFARLGAWIDETHSPSGLGIALYYDDPGATPADELR